MNKETLDTFTNFCKNQKMSSMINEAQNIVLIRVVTDILFESDKSFIKATFTNIKDVIDPIMPFVKDQSSSVLRVFAIEAFKILAFKAPHWLHELISIFLSLTTITNADITAMK